MNQTIYFSKVNPNAIIPSKKTENAGYDIYPCFNDESILILPNETKMIPTGIASACSDDYYFQLFERGSTGAKGIGQRCGVIDSGYRNEWFVPITNHNNIPLLIIKNLDKYPESHKTFYYDGVAYSKCIAYPYEKAISQAVLIPVPKIDVQELTYEELLQFKSERGLGCLGSSNK